jgi:hypothetical protein
MEPRDHGSPYTDFDISDELERQRDVSALTGSTDGDSPLEEKLAEATEKVGAGYETVSDYLPHHNVDWVSEDDVIQSSFPGAAMVRAYILKFVSPRISGFDSLQWTLEADAELADGLGFDPTSIPNHTTFSTQWWERYRGDFRTHVRYEAARAAARCQSFDIPISDEGEDLIEEFDRSTTDDEDADIPDRFRLENESRDRVFKEFSDMFDELLGYNRGPNKSIPAEDLTELATFISRRNESVEGGRDVYTKENRVTDEDYMCSEALSKPIREYSRYLAEMNYAQNNSILPDTESYDWSLNPENRDFGEGERWHDRTERGIGEQVSMLKERGMLDRPVDVCIDGTAREYNNRNDTDVDMPDGVLHRYPKYDTGYAWEDITLTAIYRGRAIVLASISKVKADEQFQCVRYLLDRARDLVDVDNVYADSEFGTQRICSYITHCGLDYVMKKRKTRGYVTQYIDDAEGRAEWTDYEIEGDDHTKHKTTLLALEKVSKAVTKSADERRAEESDDDTLVQSTLPGTTLDDEDEDEEEREHAAFITSLDVEARGLHPSGVGPRRAVETAFSVGQRYRRRWSIETAFRDLKTNFKAAPRSRCLGVRRFFMMLCFLLYNCWVVLNLIVADQMDHRDDEEIIWRKKVFIIDLHEKVFPDVQFG